MRARDIPGYEGLYKIREDGVVIRKNGTVLHGSINSYGYRVVSLTKNGKKKDAKVHRLLAVAFIHNPNPSDYDCVNHIDGDKLNNSLENLEWCDRRQNNNHAREALGYGYREKPVVQKDMGGKFMAIWRNANLAAQSVNGAAQHIGACCRGATETAYGFIWEYATIDFMKLTQAIRSEENRRMIKENEAKIDRLLKENRRLQAEMSATI